MDLWLLAARLQLTGARLSAEAAMPAALEDDPEALAAALAAAAAAGPVGECGRLHLRPLPRRQLDGAARACRCHSLRPRVAQMCRCMTETGTRQCGH